MKNNAVTIQNLGYSYPKQTTPSLSNLNLEIAAGARFGLFGPNGAGKTTLMNCLTGLLTHKQGKIFLLGNEVSRNNRCIRELFGFVPQDFSFYPELTPEENMDFFGAWYGLHKQEIKKRITELLEVLGLADVRNKQVREFSGGMKRRVNLAIAVMHNPQLLFLDEPTVGVDVQSRIAIINYLKALNANGTTLVYTSHQLNEAEDLCEEIAMIDEGKIVAHDNLKNLLAHHKEEGLEGLFLNLTGKAFRD
jgi:ABC-2 type transport system ATP-binding protein